MGIVLNLEFSGRFLIWAPTLTEGDGLGAHPAQAMKVPMNL